MAKERHNPNKIVLTPEQEKYLVKHFKHTKNEELMKRLGVSNATLHRFTRELGLTKSAQFMHRMHREASAIAKEINEASDYSAQRESAHRLWDRYHETGELPKSCFQPGVTQEMRIGKKRNKQRIEKAQKKRNETLARDYRRMRFGLEPITRLIKLRKISKPQSNLRYNMRRRRGYIVFRDDTDNVYYDKNTIRSEEMEQRARDFEMYVRPIEERGKPVHVTARTGTYSAWSDQ